MSYDEHLISQAGGDGDVIGGIEARAAKYRVRSQLPQVEDLQDDRDYLLRLVREQAAKLDAVTAILDEWASHKAFPDAEETQQWYSLGKRHAADSIRAILESKP